MPENIQDDYREGVVDGGEGSHNIYGEGGPAAYAGYPPELPPVQHQHQQQVADAADAATMAAAAMHHHDQASVMEHHDHGDHYAAAAAVAAAPPLPTHHEYNVAPQQHPGLPAMAAAGAVYNPISLPMPERIVPDKWMKKYEELKQFREQKGHMNIPVTQTNKQLNAWVRTQKTQYKLLKEGKSNHMSQIRIDYLNEIGFEWSGEKRDKFWMDRYNELVAYQSKFGNTRVPDKYEAAPQLHSWVSLQRRHMKLRKEGKNIKLSEERIRLLEKLGLECKIRESSTWMDRFMELKRYKDEKGTCDVPQKWKQNPSLGRWVDNQKTQHQKLYDGKPTHLTIERIQLLVSLGFNWRKKV